MWGAGEDYGSWEQQCAAAEEFDEGGDIEDHVVGVPVLHRLAVEHGLDLQCVRVRYLISRDDARPERTKRRERFASAPLTASFFDLPIASADVIRTRVAEDILQCVGLRDVQTRLSNHDRQLTFVVNLIASEMPRQHNWVAGIVQSSAVLHEQDRIIRNRFVPFFRVLSIVQTNAHDVGRNDRSQQLGDVGFVTCVAW